MPVLILSSSPNKNGLTAACVKEAIAGLKQTGNSYKEICLNDFKINSCKACGDGWGSCRTDYRCSINDDFNKIYDQFFRADAFIFITPVYWGDMSESMKSFTDRLRRCAGNRDEKSPTFRKRAIAVAAAGGSGRGTISCLTNMERLLQHLQVEIFDLISITQLSREYKQIAIRNAVVKMMA
ncbi:MAG: flavodoxin family protein [Firmicutes bacterium]|mgnify:CR=1 FL=1|nr:flavodoxin family protein [Bacillota bacterium]